MSSFNKFKTYLKEKDSVACVGALGFGVSLRSCIIVRSFKSPFLIRETYFILAFFMLGLFIAASCPYFYGIQVSYMLNGNGKAGHFNFPPPRPNITP
jgi:hypothetical protein